MSCNTRSKDELARATLVIPLRVNKNTNLIAHSVLTSIFFELLANAITQVKALILVGMAIINVALVKYARVSVSSLDVNIWCAHTINLRIPILHRA